MYDKHFVGLDLTGFEDSGLQRPISRVTLLVDSENAFTAGDDTGLELTADCPHATQAMADSILAQVRGYQYRMFSADDANLDPAAEPGDGVTAGSVYSVISRIAEDGSGYVDVSAPGEEELEDEYPAGGPMTQAFNRQLAQIRSRITKTAEEIRLEVERLSDGVTEMSASFSVQLRSITSRVQDAENGLSTVTQTVSSITASVKDLEGTVSSIQQSAGKISLSVTGGLGSNASIVLDVGGKKQTENLDLSNVRQSFANDTSNVTISGGTVTFNSGTFIVNSENLQIDGNGNLTVAKGATIRGSSFYSETGTTGVAITGGRMRLSYDSTLVGYVGTNRWNPDKSQKGIVFDLAPDGSFMSWGYSPKSGTNYAVKLIYAAREMLLSGDGASYSADRLYLECDTQSRSGIYFGTKASDPVGLIYGTFGLHLSSLDGKPIYLCPGAADCMADIGTDCTTFYQNSGKIVKCYNNLDMNNNTILNTSDERLKTSIEASDADALSVINSIGTYSFDWVGDGRHEALGFIAQQLEAEASPDFVAVNETDGHYSTKDLKMIPYLVRAVQQLSAAVDELAGTAARKMSRRKPWTPAAYTLAEKEAYAASLVPDTKVSEPEQPEPVILPAS